MSEKPTAIILPSWNPDEPRFIVEDAHDGLADDRAFKNGKCVYNQRLGIVYTVEYIVDALNELADKVDEQQATISKLEEEKGYWKSKAMTLLMQVCRLTPRMTAKEVIEFGKELEDE